jgi:hypothetical protein
MKKIRLFLSYLCLILIITVCFQNILGAHQTTKLSIPKTQTLSIPEMNTKNTFIRSVPFLPKIPLDTGENETSFTPTDVTISDDRFHNSNTIQYTEWWYFDADLSNNYTVQLSVHVYNILSMSFATINYNVYRFGLPIEEHRTMYTANEISLSPEEPYVFLHDDSFKMIGVFEPELEKMYYHITYTIENTSMDLYYQSLTKGWKGKTTAGDWAVMLPRATVFGTLVIDNTAIKVRGVGYHDHNWNVTISTGLNFGWVWGKTDTNTYTITWADILTTWFKGDPLLVVNKEHDGYYSVPMENLTFSITDIAFKDGMLIPNGFSLAGKTNNITINMEISVIDTDYTTVLGVINYWRYHVHSKGTVTFNNDTETIDDYDIAEFIRFRFY